jgi:tripartite-type tricarboxylate transporter receptor subunit TctC
MSSTMQTLRTRAFRAAFLLAALAGIPASAQDAYPTRPITIVVPFPAGGVADLLGRLMGEKLAAAFGQPVIVQNKPGATGNIGAELVANAKPDGHTLLSTPPPPLVINKLLLPRLPFDPAQFVPITVIAGAPNVLVAHARLRADNVSELLALARAQPGKLNYGSTGPGGTPHLTAEWFKSELGVQITHVPYTGSAAYAALIAGDVDVMFANLADAYPHLRSGKLKPLATAGATRSAALPGTPALAETVPGFVSTTWFAVVAPPGTPRAIADKLSVALNDALRQPDVVARLAAGQLEPIGGSPARTAAFFEEETQRWSRVIRQAGVKAD